MKDGKATNIGLRIFLSKHFQAIIFMLFTVVNINFVTCVMAQTTTSEHESHHPKSPSTSDTAMAGMKPKGVMPSDTSKNMAGGAKAGMGGGGMGDMMKGMGEMMKGMGNSSNKDLYPSMMQFPELPIEKRNEIIKLANQRVNDANALLLSGMENLKIALLNHDFAATQEANAQIRQGQQVLESGLATQLTIAENRSPQTTALRWFKQNLYIDQLVEPDNSAGIFGLSWFHYISMLSLVAFAIAMIWMYFQKMKRANALVEKLAGNPTPNTPPLGATDAKATLPAISPNSKPIATSVVVKTDSVGINIETTPSKPNSWTGTLLVSEIFEETSKVKTFRLTDPAGGRLPFNFLPGQFLSLTVIPNGIPVKRSYTIASSPTHRNYCELTVKHETHGIVSTYLNTQVHEGELLQITGPSGRFTFVESEVNGIVLIAGGVGITPMMSVIRYLLDHSWKKEIYLFFTCKNDKSVIFQEEIKYLQNRHPNLHVWITLTRQEHSPKTPYHSGRITKATLTKHVPEIASQRIHICGPVPMMNALKEMLEDLAVPKDNIKSEEFASPPANEKIAPPVNKTDENTTPNPPEPEANETKPVLETGGETQSVAPQPVTPQGIPP